VESALVDPSGRSNSRTSAGGFPAAFQAVLPRWSTPVSLWIIVGACAAIGIIAFKYDLPYRYERWKRKNNYYRRP